jgi:hypothetical protein
MQLAIAKYEIATTTTTTTTTTTSTTFVINFADYLLSLRFSAVVYLSQIRW